MDSNKLAANQPISCPFIRPCVIGFSPPPLLPHRRQSRGCAFSGDKGNSVGHSVYRCFGAKHAHYRVIKTRALASSSRARPIDMQISVASMRKYISLLSPFNPADTSSDAASLHDDISISPIPHRYRPASHGMDKWRRPRRRSHKFNPPFLFLSFSPSRRDNSLIDKARRVPTNVEPRDTTNRRIARANPISPVTRRPCLTENVVVCRHAVNRSLYSPC